MRVGRLAAGMAFALAGALGVGACGGTTDSGNGAFVVSIGIGEPKHLVPSTTARQTATRS